MAIVDMTLPRWGASMADGTITRWLKTVGERVEEGEVVCEVETEKVNAEVEAPATGTLREILVDPGATVDVGTPIARIEEDQ
jgi:pyruvate/2-oxoglutarate dehydrogenase complex dihydrolipoamide acyltransferase (E2) component